MDDKYEIAMKLNEDWINLYNSREYNKGRSICLILNYIKKLNFDGVIKLVRDKWAYSIMKKRYMNRYAEYSCNFDMESKEKKVVVYACILGNYDSISQPLFCEENVDYVVFSDDNTKENIGIWKVCQIPENIKKLGDVTKINRYIKMHPHELFANKYDYCIYIDGNVKIIGDIYSLLGVAHHSLSGIAMYSHKERDCIYQEAKVCKLYGKGQKKGINTQIERYRKEEFPEHFGMLEATIIVFDCSNMKAIEVFENWWKEFLESKSKRDQLSLPYVLWKCNIDCKSIGILGSNILIDKRFRVVLHEKHF